MDKRLQKIPDMNFQQMTTILMLRHIQSVKGRRVPSVQRNTPDQLGKAPQEISWEREEVPFNYRFNRTVSLLSVSHNRFSFSAGMDKASDLAERALNGEFPELPKKSPPIASKNTKKHAEGAKINKKPLFLKNSNFIQNELHP